MRIRIGRRGCFWGCGSVLLAFAGTIAIIALVFGILRSSTVYEQAFETVRTHEQAQRLLGNPVEAGWWVSGSIRTSGSGGNADITFPVSGSLADGRIRAVAFRENGEWQLTRLDLTVQGEVVPLLTGR